MNSLGSYVINMDCNEHCECPTSRLQPICSKGILRFLHNIYFVTFTTDGVTNFYSPCHAGCETKETIPDLGDPAKNTTLYSSCKCVKQATEERNTSISRPWVNRELLVKHNIEYPALDLVDRIHRWT